MGRMFKKRQNSIPADRVNLALRRARPLRTVSPRADRTQTWAVCYVIDPQGDRVEGIMIDYSSSGARIRFRHRTAFAERVRLQSPKLRLDRLAEIVRNEVYDIGVRFID